MEEREENIGGGQWGEKGRVGILHCDDSVLVMEESIAI